MDSYHLSVRETLREMLCALVHLLMWRGRLSVKGTEETCRAMIATPNNLKEDVLAGGLTEHSVVGTIRA